MNFDEIAKNRHSCRNFDPDKSVDKEIIDSILKTAILAPSACNSQPYKITAVYNEKAKQVAEATKGFGGMNKFTSDASVMLVVSEDSYNKTAAIGAKIKKNDYRSIDIGILSAYITAAAQCHGLGSCILGWFNDEIIRKICCLDSAVRLVIAIGYPSENEKVPVKKRKPYDDVVKHIT